MQIWNGKKQSHKRPEKVDLRRSWDPVGRGWHGLGCLLDAFGLFFWCSKSKFFASIGLGCGPRGLLDQFWIVFVEFWEVFGWILGDFGKVLGR